MDNNRIYYAIQQAGIRSNNQASSGTPFTAISGLQNISLNSTVNLNPIPTLGDASSYYLSEKDYNISADLTKVLDGTSLLYNLITLDSASINLIDKLAQTCDLALSIFSEQKTSATGSALCTVQCSDMSISSFKYTFDVNNSFTENIGLIGNNKIWKNDTRIINQPDINISTTGINFSGVFNNNGKPLTHINRRGDFIFHRTSGDVSFLPRDILGVDESGQPVNTHITNITVSASVNYTSVPTLGKITPFIRLPISPIEITSEISIIATSGDGISLTESGILTPGISCMHSGNLNYQTINIAICEGTRINLGNKNKLASLNYTGGDANGGNVQVSYTYKNFDNCIITHI